MWLTAPLAIDAKESSREPTLGTESASQKAEEASDWKRKQPETRWDENWISAEESLNERGTPVNAWSGLPPGGCISFSSENVLSPCSTNQVRAAHASFPL
ncbi:hypothetical protein MRX96_031999 [Rhipicephalus microplus]